MYNTEGFRTSVVYVVGATVDFLVFNEKAKYPSIIFFYDKRVKVQVILGPDTTVPFTLDPNTTVL